jgi:hypothetical protein
MFGNFATTSKSTSNPSSASRAGGYGALSGSPTHANALAADERGGLLQEDDEL